MGLEKVCAAPLFAGMNPEEVSSILQCLQAQKKEYQRGETIFPVGKAIDRIGLVLSGSVMIERDDYWGNRSILAAVGEGEIGRDDRIIYVVHVVVAVRTGTQREERHDAQ